MCVEYYSMPGILVLPSRPTWNCFCEVFVLITETYFCRLYILYATVLKIDTNSLMLILGNLYTRDCDSMLSTEISDPDFPKSLSGLIHLRIILLFSSCNTKTIAQRPLQHPPTLYTSLWSNFNLFFLSWVLWMTDYHCQKQRSQYP